jgi:hypothetical protein
MKRVTAVLAGMVSLVISSTVLAQSESTPIASSDDPNNIKSFITCLHGLKLKSGNIDQTVGCIPKNCKVTLTLSSRSAQPACTPNIPVPVGVVTLFQFPRVIFDCDSPPTTAGAPRRFRPSYTLCPAGGSDAATMQLAINRIEIGQDRTEIIFTPGGNFGMGEMMMADVPVPPLTDFASLKYAAAMVNPKAVLSTEGNDKGCQSCHENKGLAPDKARLSGPFNPFGMDVTAGGKVVRGAGAVIYTDSDDDVAAPVLPYTAMNLTQVCDLINMPANLAAIKTFYANPANSPMGADTSRLSLLCAALAAKFPGS